MQATAYYRGGRGVRFHLTGPCGQDRFSLVPEGKNSSSTSAPRCADLSCSLILVKTGGPLGQDSPKRDAGIAFSREISILEFLRCRGAPQKDA